MRGLRDSAEAVLTTIISYVKIMFIIYSWSQILNISFLCVTGTFAKFSLCDQSVRRIARKKRFCYTNKVIC